MKLREICETLDISRRALQGYEKAGLVSATGRNKYGHLLYDETAKLRIEKIKFYQQLGFSLKEISSLIDAPNIVVKEALEKQEKSNYNGNLSGCCINHYRNSDLHMLPQVE